MNGEMHQICMLVNAARKALIEKKEFKYLCDEYINSIRFYSNSHSHASARTQIRICENDLFHTIPRKPLFHEKVCEAKSAQEWFHYCIKKEVYDIKFLTSLQVKDRKLLGFSNVDKSCIVTFYKNQSPAAKRNALKRMDIAPAHNAKRQNPLCGPVHNKLVTYWTATWEFENSLKKWNVEYQEYKWDDPPEKTPQFENNIKEFMDILFKIGEFADQIDFKNFGNIFRNAHDILNGKSEIPDTYPNGRQIHLPNISEEKKRMYYAASIADVFGAMGSWNDSPPYYAHEKGLDDDYEALSDELLKQIRLAVLYAINEN